MSLLEYFENTEGTGVLATADSNGNVDVAIYARPHVIDEETVAFIMNEKLSYQYVTSNPKAAYLFIEDAGGYKGIRLYLTMTKEESDKETIESVRRRCSVKCDDSEVNKHLVYFKVDKTRELIGG